MGDSIQIPDGSQLLTVQCGSTCQRMVPASPWPLPETVTILRRSQKDDAPASFPIVDISGAEHFSQSQPTESLNRLLSDREFDRNK